MSEVDLTQRGGGGGGVNPSFTATGIFPSGLDASGPVDVASAFAASGLEASALIKGTIGNFLATALAGSGFNASGQTQLTSVIVACGINSSGPVLGTSGVFPCGIVASGPLILTSGDFQSGITTSALVSIGGSLNVAATGVFFSDVNVGGQLTASGTQMQVCGVLKVGNAFFTSANEVVFNSGVNLSGPLSGASATFQSGITTSALVSIGGSVLVESNLQVAGNTSVGALAVMSNLRIFGSQSPAIIISAASGATDALDITRSGIATIVVFKLDSSGNISTSGNFAGTSGIFQSGINTSGTDTEVSILVACTLAVSGFTSFGGSTVVASALQACGVLHVGTSILASGDLNVSQATVRGGLSVAGSVAIGSTTSIVGSLIVCGPIVGSNLLSVLAINVSTINGSPPGTTTSTFTSGLTTCALLSAGATFIADGSVILLSIVDVSGQINAASIISESGLNLSGTETAVSILVACTLAVSGLVSAPSIAVTTLSGLNVTTSTETITTLLSVGGSILGQSGATFSGLVSATSFVGAFAFTSVDAASGGTFSGLLSQGASILVACTLAVSGLVSAPSIAVTTLSALNVTTSTETVTTLLSLGGSLLGQSGATFSGLVSATSFVGAFVFTSADAASGGTFSALFSGVSGLFACTLAVSGITSLGGSLAAASGLNTSGPVLAGTTMSTAGSVVFTSTTTYSGGIVFVPGSQFASAGSALISIGFASGTQTSYIIFASVGSVGQVFALTTCGLVSVNQLNTSTVAVTTLLSVNGSGVFVSGLNASGKAALVDATISTETVTTLLSAGGSILGQSGATFSGLVSATSFVGAFVLTSATAQSGGTWSALGSFGGSVIMTCGLNVSGVIQGGTSLLLSGDLNVSQATVRGGLSTAGSVAIGSTTSIVGSLIVCGPIVGSNLLSVLAINVSTINGSPPGTTTSTFSSGLTTCALMSVGASMIVDGTASFGASAIFESGINLSGTETALSVLVACTLTASGLLSVGGSGTFTSGIQTSGMFALNSPSTIQSAGLALISVMIPTGSTTSNVITVISSGVTTLFNVDTSGAVIANAALTAGGLSITGGAAVQGNFVANNVQGITDVGTLSVQGSTNSSDLRVSGLLKAIGGTQYNVQSINTSLTLTLSKTIIQADASAQGSQLVVTLPSAATVTGQMYKIVKTDGSVNSVVVAAIAGDTIEGLSQLTATTKYGKFDLIAGGSVTWFNFGSGLI